MRRHARSIEAFAILAAIALIAACLVPSSVTAELPGSIKSGPVYISNKTDETIYVACLSYVDAAGKTRQFTKAENATWSIKPGQAGALSIKESRIVASNFKFAIITDQTKQGVSFWQSTDADFDAEGRLYLVINRGEHLEKIAKQDAATMRAFLSKEPLEASGYSSYMERRLAEVGRIPALSEQQKQQRLEQRKQQVKAEPKTRFVAFVNNTTSGDKLGIKVTGYVTDDGQTILTPKSTEFSIAPNDNFTSQFAARTVIFTVYAYGASVVSCKSEDSARDAKGNIVVTIGDDEMKAVKEEIARVSNRKDVSTDVAGALRFGGKVGEGVGKKVIDSLNSLGTRSSTGSSEPPRQVVEDRPTKCLRCNGTGRGPFSEVPCRGCGGDGEVIKRGVFDRGAK